MKEAKREGRVANRVYIKEREKTKQLRFIITRDSYAFADYKLVILRTRVHTACTIRKE